MLKVPLISISFLFLSRISVDGCKGEQCRKPMDNLLIHEVAWQDTMLFADDLIGQLAEIIRSVFKKRPQNFNGDTSAKDCTSKAL